MTATVTETGTRDTTYNLISAAYHSLQGAETYTMYIDDAKQAGNKDLVEFFQRAQDLNREIADEAKRHLMTMLKDSSK